jgi:PAS domain S-box-containing protein
MKIRTQFIISVILFAAILITLATSLAVVNSRVEQNSQQEDLANNIERLARELGYTANSYLLYGESQMRTRWESTFDDLSTDLSNINRDGRDEQVVADSIKTNMASLNTIFTEVSAAIERNSQTPAGFFDQSFIQVSWSRLEVQNQAVVFDASRLSSIFNKRLNQERQISTILIFVLVAVFAIYIFSTYLWLFRRTLKSIFELNKGAIAIGSGNLNYAVPERHKDEVGDLSRAFNRMTTQLKTVTASKAELEKEIQERKTAEEALRENEKEYKSLAENIPDIVTRYDRDLHHIFVNTAASQAAGIQAEAFIGKTNLELGQDPEQVEFWMKHVRNVFASGKPETMEFDWMAPDGLRYQQTIITPEFDSDGSVKTVLCVTHNLTDIKRAEEALKKYTNELEAANKELESFAYSVSHDLRTPLRTLDGFSEMVVMEYGDKLDETGKNYLNRIRKAGQTMAQLTEDILKLSRITRAEMHRDEIDLSEMAKSITEELKAAQPQRQAEFIVASGIMVKGDKALLEILLRNLLENSWKYTGQRLNAKIEVGMISQIEKEVYYIKDNGIGFDMKYYDKLFQPFQRLTTDKAYSGTGIGLATAQRVIRRHGGKIWAESEVGKGTTFYFTIE